jgi:hypothetical protein
MHLGAVLQLHGVRRERKTFSSNSTRALPPSYIIDGLSRVAFSSAQEASGGATFPTFPSQAMRGVGHVLLLDGASLPDNVSFRGIVVSVQDTTDKCLITMRDLHGPDTVRVFCKNQVRI